MNGQNLLGILMVVFGLALTCGGVLELVREKGSDPPLSGERAEAGGLASPRPGGPDKTALSSEEKGLKFEGWVVRKFGRPPFKLMDWRGDKRVDGISAESATYPDMVVEFRLRDRHASFTVECKWRRAFLSGRKSPAGIEWATSRQIENYQRFQQDRRMPVFVVIGIGGEPDRPAEVYVVPLDRLRYPFATAEYLAKFRKADPEKNFFYDPEKVELR